MLTTIRPSNGSHSLTPINNSQNLGVSRTKWPMEFHQTLFFRHQIKAKNSGLGTRLVLRLADIQVNFEIVKISCRLDYSSFRFV